MEQRNPRLRWLVVWVLAVVWMVAVLARLSYLQLFCYSEYLAKAQHQQQRIFEISPKRGTIYDRKGRELAVSLPMDSVFADPAEDNRSGHGWSAAFAHPGRTRRRSRNENPRSACAGAAGARSSLRKSCSELTDMNLRGVFFQKENRRVYPQRELAAHVLGFMDVDEKGIGGIEYSLDKAHSRPPRQDDGHGRWKAPLV